MTYLAMYVSDVVLETSPANLGQDLGLRNEDLRNKYVVVHRDVGVEEFSIHTRDDFYVMYRWKDPETHGAWVEVVPVSASRTTELKAAMDQEVVLLNVTYMGDAHVTMQMEVPRNCPESVKFGGVSLILMVRLLEGLWGESRSFTQDYSWQWELGSKQ